MKPLQSLAKVALWRWLSHRVTKWKMAGVAGLEPVTSAVTGQRSNQLSYAPARGTRTYESPPPASSRTNKMFEQQTPRRWGWGTPLKKRTATRMTQCYSPETFCQPSGTRFRMYFQIFCRTITETCLSTIKGPHRTVVGPFLLRTTPPESPARFTWSGPASLRGCLPLPFRD